MIMLIGFFIFLAGLIVGLIWASPHTIYVSVGEHVAAGLLVTGFLTMGTSAGIFIWNHLP
jgi:hypothetical protein